MPWYKEWFDENYLKLYQHRDKQDALKQVDLILKAISLKTESDILDLACGEGRYCQLLWEKGYRPTGIDLSVQLITSGKKKYPHLNLKEGDMREIKGKYDLILSLFTSFGYFTPSQDNLVLESIYDCLKKRGYFWLDFFNAQYIKKTISSSYPKSHQGLGVDNRISSNKRTPHRKKNHY